MAIDHVAELAETSHRVSTAKHLDDGELVRVVAEARAGTGAAWEALIQRFGGLVAAIARQCRLERR